MLMNPSVNINGTSRESLVADRRKAMDALQTAMDALHRLLPHGRDYVGRSLQYDMDRKTHADRHTALVGLYCEVQAEALAIMNAGPRGGAA